MIIPSIFNGHRAKGFFTTKINNRDIIPVFYLPIQKHTDTVQVIDDILEPGIADAVITDKKGLFIGIQVADCVPILLHDHKQGVVAAVHAGWRGTAANILQKTISAMTVRFSSSPSDIIVAVGPSIRGCCYEVGGEVIEAVNMATRTAGDHYIKRGGKNYLDLQAANRYQALSAGISANNIWLSDECTFCLPEKYYSYRYSNGTTGRQYGVIGIK